MKRSITLIILGLASSLFALSPPPEGFTEKPLEESWTEAKIVVYGPILKLEALHKDGRFIGYVAHLEPRKLWKGEKKKTYEIFVGEGPSQHSVEFEFMKTYVAFLGDDISPHIDRKESVHLGQLSSPVEFVKGPPFEGLFPDRGDSKLPRLLEAKEELEIEPGEVVNAR
ncbi:MAG: hypothetical protein AAF546_07180 [Verrucomicrobiota bacterium]